MHYIIITIKKEREYSRTQCAREKNVTDQLTDPYMPVPECRIHSSVRERHVQKKRIICTDAATHCNSQEEKIHIAIMLLASCQFLRTLTLDGNPTRTDGFLPLSMGDRVGEIPHAAVSLIFTPRLAFGMTTSSESVE